MGIFDWFKKKKDEEKSLEGLKQCDKGHYYNKTDDSCPFCENSNLQYYEKCDKGHFYIGIEYDSCPYCENSSSKSYDYNEDGVEVYKNGQIKYEGKTDIFWGGCLSNCGGEGCVECLPSIFKKRGLWKYYYENGQLKEEGGYKDDKKEGLWKHYYEDGILELEINHENNKIYGRWYYENGQLKKEGGQIDYIHNGLWKHYYEDGVLEREIEHTENGWNSTRYYNNGQLKGKLNFKKENNTLSEKYWDKDSNEIEEENLERETEIFKLETNILKYHKNGNIKFEGNYPGHGHTWWWEEDSFGKSYYENGVLEREEEVTYYKNSCGRILIKEYFDNSQLKSEGEYCFDCDCLSWGGPVDCRRIGNPCPECFISKYWKNGLWKYYFRNGKLRMEGEYIWDNNSLNHIQNGVWKIFDNTGKVYNELTYKEYQEELKKKKDEEKRLKGLIQCDIGHYYQKTYDSCPFC